MRTEEIEKYLSHRMTDEERAAFEQEMAVSPELRDDVKMVAWTIASIREVGHEQDQERIRRMKSAMPGDHKRMVSSVAATLIVGIMVAATISVPIIKHVTKSAPSPEQPVIELPQPATPEPQSEPQSSDTIALPVATKPAAETKESSKAPEVKKEKVGKEEEIKEPPAVKMEKLEKEEEIKEPPAVKEEKKEDNEVKSVSNAISTKTDSEGVKYEVVSIHRDENGLLAVTMRFTNPEYTRNLEFEISAIDDDGDFLICDNKSFNVKAPKGSSIKKIIVFRDVKHSRKSFTLSIKEKKAIAVRTFRNLKM